MSDEATNGTNGALTDIVTLKLRRQPWHLEVGGTVENLVLYRLMLLEALRVVEQQLRLQDAAQIMQAQRDAAQAAAILGKVRGNGL